MTEPENIRLGAVVDIYGQTVVVDFTEGRVEVAVYPVIGPDDGDDIVEPDSLLVMPAGTCQDLVELLSTAVTHLGDIWTSGASSLLARQAAKEAKDRRAGA